MSGRVGGSRPAQGSSAWLPVRDDSARGGGARAAVLVIAALGLAPAPAEAQPAAHQAVDRAFERHARGETPAARRVLEHALAGCAGVDEPGSCRGLIAAGIGYLYHLEGRHEPDAADSLFRAAHDQYRRSLADDPTQQDVVYNLAVLYREMGPHEWQEPFLRDAPRHDPARRTQYAVMLGDYYRDQRRWSEALDAYREALAGAPDHDGARAGLAELYGELEPELLGELLVLALQWEQRAPETADRAYGVVLESALDERPPRGRLGELAGEALVRRVALRARDRALGPDLLSGLPSSWAPATELRDYLADPRSPPPAGSWWTAETDRARALAKAGLALGAATLAGAETAGRRDAADSADVPERAHLADAYWATAAKLVPLDYAEALDLQRELALLWLRYPSLDPGGARFAALEHDLFEVKGQALAARDLEAAQRYHTALALVYAAREVWSSPQHPARNAVQQLRWALQAAERRHGEDGFVQPLPELKRLLGQGLAARGESSAAADAYRAAAAALLDVDDIDSAARAARSAARLAVRAEPDVGLTRLIELRDRLARVAQLAPAEAASLCDPLTIERAVRGAAAAASAADSRFPGRQLLKARAACAEHGPREHRLPYSVGVVQLVVEEDVPLVGMGDLLRYERAAAALEAAVGMRPSSVRLDLRGAPVTPPGARVVPLSLPGDATRAYVVVPRETVLTHQIVRAVDPREHSYRLRIVDAAVEIETADEGEPAITRTIERLPAVAEVRVRPPSR